MALLSLSNLRTETLVVKNVVANSRGRHRLRFDHFLFYSSGCLRSASFCFHD